MSYQKLNQVTCPFSSPIPRCDDVVQDIDTEINYFIDVETDSGYWQVVTEEEAHKILELFTPEVKCQWKMIPMGFLNEAPAFAAMITKLKMELDTLSKERRLKNSAYKLLFIMY